MLNKQAMNILLVFSQMKITREFQVQSSHLYEIRKNGQMCISHGKRYLQLYAIIEFHFIFFGHHAFVVNFKKKEIQNSIH